MMTRGGEAPNAIAERTEGRWYVRADTLAELADVEARVMRCFEAGALASGADLTVTPESKPYAEFRTDEGLLACYERRATAVGRHFSSGPDAMMARASTDMGNVSRCCRPFTRTSASTRCPRSTIKPNSPRPPSPPPPKRPSRRERSPWRARSSTPRPEATSAAGC